MNFYKYDAFISYRHTMPDKAVAERLHRLLETFKIPKSIVKSSGKKRINRVFRDREELPTSSDLAENITKALESSEYLIVICSPRTKKSQWVLKEIETFKKLHGQDKVLALLIEGEPNESFPEQLRIINETQTLEDGSIVESTIEVEPLAADIRAASEKEMFKKLRNESLRLLSPMLNCSYDDLKQRHKERLIKAVLTTSISLSAFFLAFGSFSAYQAYLINQKSLEVSKKSEEIKQKSYEINQKNLEITAQIKETQIGQSRYLADISDRYFEDGDRYRAILAAQAALPKDMSNPDRPYVPEAEYALSQALSVYEADYYFDGDIVLDHDMGVSYFDISPDGKTLLTVCKNGYIYFWNVEDGKPIGKVFTNKGLPLDGDILFINNSTVIAVAESESGFDNYIVCVDIYGNSVWQIADYASILTHSADKNILAYYRMGKICFADVVSGDIFNTIDVDNLMEADSDSHDLLEYVSCMAFSKNGDFLAVGTSVGKAFVFDMESFSLINTYKTRYNQISDIDYSEDGSLAIISNFFGGDLGLLDAGKGSLDLFSPNGKKTSISFNESYIEKASFFPSYPTKLVFVEDKKINLIDIQKGVIESTFIHGDYVSDYYIINDIIISSSFDGTIRFWFKDDNTSDVINYRVTRKESIDQVAHTKGKLIFSLRNSEKVYIYKPIINDKTKTLEGHNKSVHNAVLSQDGRLALSYTFENSELFLWDVINSELLLKAHYNDTISEVLFADNDNVILIAFTSGELKAIKTSDFSVVSEIQANAYFDFYTNYDLTLLAIPSYSDITIYSIPDLKIINVMDYSGIDFCTFINENKLFIVNKNNMAGVADINSGNELFNIEDKDINNGVISDDGKTCVLSYKNKSIKTYDIENTVIEKISLDNLIAEDSVLFLSPDKKLLFVQFIDNSISIFDTINGTLIKTIEKNQFPAQLKNVVFSKNNDRIALIGISFSYILDAETLKPLASATFSDINNDFSTIISTGSGVSNTVYIMPYYSTQMLLDEAKRQLKGRTLTEKEKAEMFIN
jgi:WD40 repeat protein